MQQLTPPHAPGPILIILAVSVTELTCVRSVAPHASLSTFAVDDSDWSEKKRPGGKMMRAVWSPVLCLCWNSSHIEEYKPAPPAAKYLLRMLLLRFGIAENLYIPIHRLMALLIEIKTTRKSHSFRGGLRELSRLVSHWRRTHKQVHPSRNKAFPPVGQLTSSQTTQGA